MFFCCAVGASQSETLIESFPEPGPSAEPSLFVVPEATSTDGEAAPEATSRAFEVALTRDSSDASWGFNREMDAMGLHVVQLGQDADGPVQVYNAAAAEEDRLCEGDVIVSVNLVTDPATMGRMLRTETEVNLVIRRPWIFDEKVAKGEKPLGISISHLPGGRVLHVDAIAEESVVRASAAKVAVGDRILRVNGRSGTFQELLREIQVSDAPLLTVSRFVAS
mmetsp:Transcript_7514/g.15176  ORF Transcript_7514/g.15176 Transcript_7514/m.15176 type:complete len:222 (+) Transcript_7514:34-699(+)